MTVTFRMSAGNKDTSGDYNSYDTVTEYKIGEAIAGIDTSEEAIVRMKGNGSGYSLALWTDGKFFYSIKMSDEQSEEVFLNIISGMKEGK